MDWYLAVLKKYAVFDGRASRREYWMFFLINLLISIVLGAIDGLFRSVFEAALGTDLGTTGFLGSLYGLAVLIPSIAVAVRRLHDTGRSGWWLFLNLIPIIGFIVVIVFLASEGQPGPNRYGPNPKGLPPGAVPSASSPGAAPSPSAPGPAPSTPTSAGWMTDPTGRHQLRYWDAQRWTSHVSDGGVQSEDPIA